MAQVRRLPEDLINQIAAGEVVERPASVVKELVENALDAGASSVEVLLEEGGARLIEVKDNGTGMAPDDARLALDRHATSKLSTEADLSSISTLGFRGEALPAIASVSHFSMTTRLRAAAVALRLEVDGGAGPRASEVAAPEGTRVVVADLFYNTPARRKFLKRRETEAAHCTEVLTRLSLSRPEVGFQLASNGRRLLGVGKDTPLRDRVALAVGRETHEALVAIEGHRGLVEVTGFAGSPDVSAATSQRILLFVNGRAVRDRSLQHAVTRAYANLLPPGRYPVAVLFVRLPLDQVDVNVHPQKSEVRFADPRSVYEAVSFSVADALRPAPWLASGQAALPDVFAEPLVGTAPFDAAAWSSAALAREGTAVFAPRAGAWGGATGGASLWAEPVGYFARLRFLGQIAGTYLVCEGPAGGLVVLDQHAAHERVLFEELRAQRRERPLLSQRLLVPAVVELGPPQAAALEANRERLSALGFEVEPFGGGSYAVQAVPAVLGHARLGPLLTDLSEQLSHFGAADAAQDAENDILATLACHAAIRAGDPLGAEEVRALFDKLDGIDFKVRCPHGRPVVTELSIAELEKRVERR